MEAIKGTEVNVPDAVFAWLLFGETFTGLALLGMVLTVWGVYLARK